ncbi:MAG: glycosyltransferase family 9 protein, partial [Anaerolineae bacterium]
SAIILEDSPLVDEVIVFDKFRYDRPLDALRPGAVADMFCLGWDLRRRVYDHLIILHHLTTRWGAIKFAALALTSGARRRVGLDNGRGWFLTERVKDEGFGYKHEVEYCLEVVGKIGASSDDQRMEIAIPPGAERWAEEMMRDAGFKTVEGPLVAIHPGSGSYSLARRWAPERFAQVADALVERHGARIVLVGKEGNGVAEVASAMRAEALNLAERTTLKQLAALLKRCDLFIGADSGVMHLAAAVGTSIVAIFGPSNPRAWGPWTASGGQISVTVRADLPCSPCSYVGFSLGRRCQTRECLEAIKPDMVLEAVERMVLR